MMKIPIHFLAAAATTAAALLPARADTRYPAAVEAAATNRALVAAAAGDCPVAVATVKALSRIRRTPDLFPPDGDFRGPVRFVAAKGEYEAASVQLFSTADIAAAEARLTPLVSAAGDEIPASAIDAKVVKVWYQMGTAWTGYHEDSTRRVATPELLLNDERLVEVDHDAREYFVRCATTNGTDSYLWCSFEGRMANYSRDVGNIDISRVRDAESPKPFELKACEFKQLWLTLHAPAEARPGLYAGRLEILAGGRVVAEKRVEARILPFSLPRKAKTFRDPSKPWNVTISTKNDVLSYVDCERYARDLAAHNVLAVGVPKLAGYDDEEAAAVVRRLAAAGIDVKRVNISGCNITTSYPLEEDDFSYWRFVARVEQMTNDVARVKALCGEDAVPWAYGIDEAGPAKVRAQRALWQAVHALGALTCASSHMGRYLLFDCDIVHHPQQPSPLRSEKVAEYHAMNPDGEVYWYADPHAGPESPAYVRWLYSWKSWRAGYDGAENYILFRNNWCEWWYPQEPMFRCLCWAYPAADGIVATPAWEAYREAADDLRYATVMMDLAREAKASQDVNASYVGRAALAWIAQTDAERADMDYMRLETVRRILGLMKALGKEELP